MKKIRVMIIEDSAVVRGLLEHIIENDSRLEVAASTASAEDALALLNRVSPDVITMDIHLPGMNGFEATRKIMSEKPTPIVVVSAGVETQKLNIEMEALRAGALTVVEKPQGTTHADYVSVARHLCTQIVIMSQVKVIRQSGNRWLNSPPTIRAEKKIVTPARASRSFKILGIASSTGGPSALITLFEGLGGDFPLPILLVQHITPSFLEEFARWLDDVTPFHAVIAKNGDRPAAGTIHVAPVEQHLRLGEHHMTLDPGPPVSYQRPSGTVLFQSMAAALGENALGVILTGMGDDGADGLVDIRRAGGYTIAEDASTAVVYGMPGAAVERGAVCESLPLPAIASRLRELVGKGVNVG